MNKDLFFEILENNPKLHYNDLNQNGQDAHE